MWCLIGKVKVFNIALFMLISTWFKNFFGLLVRLLLDYCDSLGTA